MAALSLKLGTLNVSMTVWPHRTAKTLTSSAEERWRDAVDVALAAEAMNSWKVS
jgi:hypothetical protein